MIPGVSVEVGPAAVVLVGERPLQVLSSAVVRGGFTEARAIVNLHVHKNDPCLDPAAMIEAYRHVESGSVSDAIEQNLHRKSYMSHRMQAIFTTRFAGYALTVKMEKSEGGTAADVQGMLHAIDTGGKDQIYVMQVQDGADIAGMGGLMGTAMHVRGFEGAVIDGGVRDLAQLKKINFPVYALGPVPST